MNKKSQAKKQTNIIQEITHVGGPSDIRNDIKKIKAKITSSMSSNKEIQNKIIPEAFRQISEICNKETEYHEAFAMRGNIYTLMGDF